MMEWIVFYIGGIEVHRVMCAEDPDGFYDGEKDALAEKLAEEHEVKVSEVYWRRGKEEKTMSRWDKVRAEMATKSYEKDVERRIENLIKYDEFVFSSIDDETLIYDSWLYNMPDEATLEDYKDIASDDSDYTDMLEVFARIVMADNDAPVRKKARKKAYEYANRKPE